MNSRSEDSADGYRALQLWVEWYHGQLKLIEADQELQLEHEGLRIDFAIDFYDLAGFAFPFHDLLTKSRDGDNISDEAIGQSTRNFAARYYLLKDAAKRHRVVLLPPYEEELADLLTLLNYTTREIKGRPEPVELLREILVDASEDEELLVLLAKRFDRVLLLYGGYYHQGLREINWLFGENLLHRYSRGAEELPLIGDHEFLEHVTYWDDILKEVKGSAKARHHSPRAIRRDAFAIAMVTQMNRYAERDKRITVLVSGAAAMGVAFRLDEQPGHRSLGQPDGLDSEVGKTRGQGRSLLAVPFNTVPTILRTPDYFLVLMYIQRNDVTVLEEVRRRVSLIEEFERVSEGIARSVGSTLDMKTMRDTGVFSVIEELERDRHELSNLQMYLHLQPVLPKGWDERLREGVGSVWRSIEQLQTSGDIGGEISSAIHRLEKEMASLLQGIQAETAPLAQLPVQEDSSVLSWLPLFVRFHSDALEKKRRELYDTWTQQRSKVNDSEAREQISSMLVVARRVGSRSEQRLLWCVVLLTYRLYGPAIAIAQRQIAAELSQEDCQFRCVLGYAQTMTESIEGRRKAAKTLRDARSKYSTSPLPCHLLAFCIGTSHEKKLGAEFRLGEAIDLERETLKLAGSDYEIEGSAKNNLAYYLSQLAMETRDHEPVSEAVEVAKQLSAFMENYHVVRPEWLHTIGFTYYVASQFAGSEAERRQYRRDAKTELIRIDLLPNVTAVCKAVAGELLSSLE